MVWFARQLLAAILSFLLTVPVFSNGNDQPRTDTYDYDAFGNLTHSSTTLSTPTLNNYLFAGEQFDPDLNLYYNRARYLNVSTGRFWTMDDFEGIDQDPFSLHKYLYASSDPVNRLDAGGHDDLVETLGGTLPVSIILAAAVTVVLADACVVYADFTGGEGPCGNKNENEGRIRFQLQLGTLYTEPGTPVVTNIDPPGVTILQARTLGLQPLDISARSSVRFPYTRYQWDFFFAVIMMSQDLDRFVPFGYSGFKRSLLSEPIGNSGWRIDMDNLEGTNLRQ